MFKLKLNKKINKIIKIITLYNLHCSPWEYDFLKFSTIYHFFVFYINTYHLIIIFLLTFKFFTHFQKQNFLTKIMLFLFFNIRLFIHFFTIHLNVHNLIKIFHFFFINFLHFSEKWVFVLFILKFPIIPLLFYILLTFSSSHK